MQVDFLRSEDVDPVEERLGEHSPTRALGLIPKPREIPDSLSGWLASQLSKDRTVVRLSTRGSISLSQYTRLQDTIESAREVFGGIEDRDASGDLVVRPDDDDFADVALTGFAQKAVERLRGAATGVGPDAQAARDALGLLVRLASGRMGARS